MTKPRDTIRATIAGAGALCERASGACRERLLGLLDVDTDERAQSEVLGVVLLLGIAIIGIGVAFTLGFSAFDAGKDSADVGQAEQSFSQLDKEASAVALGDARVRDVDLGFRANGGQVRTESSSGWIRVRIINDSDGTVDWSTQASLGAVVYENGRTTVAYQGGGIWRSDGSGSVMVSEPEVHYRGGTLTVPVVSIRGERGVYSRVQVTPAGETDRRFPDPENNQTNRLKSGKVEVTVQSEYYEAWGQYFEDSTNAYVYYDDANQEATAVFLAIPRWGTLDDGIIATSGAGKLRLVATGAYIDSYDSGVGPYSVSRSANGTVRAVGDILTKSDSQILGDVYSGAVVTVRDTSLVDGDAYWTDDLVLKNSGTVTGVNDSISGVPAITPIDGFVELSVQRIRNDNDNDRTTVVQSNELDIDGSSAKLEAGSYYLENFHLEGEELELDTSDGDISIAVRDWVKLERSGGVGSTLNVTGNGTVRFFVESEHAGQIQVTGEGKRNVNLGIGKKSNVHVVGQDSPQLRLYGPQNFEVAIAGTTSSNESFVGVIYAPAGQTGDGRVYIKHADVYGQILTGNLTLGKSGAVHYDRNLEGTKLPQSPTVARLEFLHVAVHPVNVSNANVHSLASPGTLTSPGTLASPRVDARVIGDVTESRFGHRPRRAVVDPARMVAVERRSLLAVSGS